MANPANRHSMSSDTSSTRRHAPNFSRPQPQQSAMKSGRKNNQSRHVHIIEAFHEPNRALPDEPRFSEESERTDQASSENSAGSEVAWDGHAGEPLDSSQTHWQRRHDKQRYAYSATARPATPRTNSALSTASSGAQDFELGLPRGASSSHLRPSSQQIVKRVSVDQRSERLSPGPSASAEDSGSHHTASESGGDAGSIDMEGQWHSSEYDTSGLSERELRRMEKKGIDPALYLEMKEAKKGKKKWMPQLLGNGYVN